MRCPEQKLLINIFLYFFLSLFVPCTWAIDYGFSWGLEEEYSNNIKRVSVQPEDELISIPYVQFSFLEDKSRILNGNINSRIEYQKFHHGTYNDDTLFSLDSNFEWAIVPKQYTWTLLEDYRQISIDSTAVDQVDNRQNSNVFVTGPNVSLYHTKLDNLVLEARYTNLYYEKTTTDNNRYGGAVRWVRKLTPLRTISVNYEMSFVNFRDNQYADFSQQDYFLRFNMLAKTSELNMDLGVSRIKRARASSVNGLLSRFEWKRKMTSSSDFIFRASGVYSDVGNFTRLSTSTTELTPGEDQVNTNVFFEKRAEVFFNRQGSYMNSQLSVFYSDMKYQDHLAVTSLDNRIIKGGHIVLGYAFSPTMNWSIENSYSQVRYRDISRMDKDNSLTFRIGRRINRPLTLALQITFYKRRSNVETQNISEHQGLITLNYATR